MLEIRCPACFQLTLTSKRTVFSCSACAWHGSREDLRTLWEMRRLEVARPPKVEAGASQPKESTTLESAEPRRDFKPQPGETPRDRQLATRGVIERLQKMGVRLPINMGMSDNARPLTDDEVARRDPRPAQMTDEERQREARYQHLRRSAGIGPSGFIAKRG